MKKIISLMVVLVTVLVMAACSQTDSDDTTPHKPEISIVEGKSTDLIVGSALPDFKTYFTVTDEKDGDIEVTSNMIRHNIPVNGDNKAITKGIYDVTISFTNSVGGKLFKKITVNVIDDPNDLPLSDWGIENYASITEWESEGDNNVIYKVLRDGDTMVLEAGIETIPSNAWDINLGIMNLPTKQGKKYTVNVTMKTDIAEGRDFTTFLEDTDNGYAKYFEETNTLTTEYQTFTFEYTMGADDLDNNDTKLGVFLGNVNSPAIGKVYIKDFSIIEEDGVIGANPLHQFDINFPNSDAVLKHEEHYEASGHVDYSIEDDQGTKVLVVDVQAQSGDDWGIQVYDNVTLIANTSYEVSVTLKAEAARQIGLQFEGSSRYSQDIINATTDYQTFTFIIDGSQYNEDASNAKVGLFLGKIGGIDSLGKVYIKDYTITEYTAVVENPLHQFEIEFPNSDATLEHEEFHEANGNVTYTIEDDQGTKVLVVDVQGQSGDDWGIQVYDKVDLMPSRSYNVNVTLKVEHARKIALLFEGASRYNTDVIDATTDYQTYTFTIDGSQYANGYEDAKVGLFLGKIDGIDSLGKVFIKDYTVTEGDISQNPLHQFDIKFPNSDYKFEHEEHWEAEGNVTYTIEDDQGTKVLVVDVQGQSGDDWGIQVYDKVTLAANTSYEVSVTLKAEVARQIGLQVEGNSRYSTDVIDATTDYQTFTFVIDGSQYTEDISDTKVGLFLGKIAGVDSLGKVFIKEYVVTEAASN